MQNIKYPSFWGYLRYYVYKGNLVKVMRCKYGNR